MGQHLLLYHYDSKALIRTFIGVDPKIIMTMILNTLPLSCTLIALDKLWRTASKAPSKAAALKESCPEIHSEPLHML